MAEEEHLRRKGPSRVFRRQQRVRLTQLEFYSAEKTEYSGTAVGLTAVLIFVGVEFYGAVHISEEDPEVPFPISIFQLSRERR